MRGHAALNVHFALVPPSIASVDTFHFGLILKSKWRERILGQSSKLACILYDCEFSANRFFQMPNDSFNEFRSDFIHLSVSLTSSTKSKNLRSGSRPSNLYLTPKLFAHFWSWCSLFDGALSLPIRQGSYFPLRHTSPKFGRHLATVKYRISFPRLYFVHGYIDDSRESKLHLPLVIYF